MKKLKHKIDGHKKSKYRESAAESTSSLW